MKSVGIWGFGISGKSVLNFLHSQTNYSVSGILDKRTLSDDEKNNISTNIRLYTHEEQDEFLEQHTLIIPSPGIDLRNYKQYSHKFIHELDLFLSWVKIPFVVITGSIGKTTITHVLTSQLKLNGINAVACGNIGFPLLHAVTLDADLLICELSSFQLEHSKLPITAELAIITNIYPNHLDRHDSWEAYCSAKLKVCDAQKIITAPSFVHLIPQDKHSSLITGNNIHKTIPTTGYKENWEIIYNALYALNILDPIIDPITLPPHRLEYVGEYNGLKFYNDSKSTVNQSTIAAITYLQDHELIVLLGGVSKGIPRTEVFSFLQRVTSVKNVYAFGKEGKAIAQEAKKFNLTILSYETLEKAFYAAINSASYGSTILLSPGGTSYDLFKNFEERGNRFKELIYNLQNQ